MGDYLLGVKGTLNNMGITDIGVTIAPRVEIVSLRKRLLSCIVDT